MKNLSKLVGVLLVVLAVAVLAVPVFAAEAKGRIKSVNAEKQTFVLDSNGKDFTFEMGKDAKVQLNNEASRLRDLKPKDEVTITYEKVGDRFVASEIKAARAKE